MPAAVSASPFSPSPFPRCPRALIAVLAALGSACADPGAKFDEFLARTADAGGEQTTEQEDDAATSASDQTLPDPEKLTGTYLSVTSFTGAPLSPILNRLELTASRSGTGDYALSMRFQPLAFADRMTQVGSPSGPFEAAVQADGEYITDPLRFDTPGRANPLLMLDSLSDLALHGALSKRQEDENGQVTFFCGTISGQLVTPLTQTLTGTFTAQRITDPSDYPDPVINCAMDPAGSL